MCVMSEGCTGVRWNGCVGSEGVVVRKECDKEWCEKANKFAAF